MASGHVNRIYRPNTWQHRPSLRREDFSCQPGAVHTWHQTEMPKQHGDVHYCSFSGGVKGRFLDIVEDGLLRSQDCATVSSTFKHAGRK